MIAPYQVYGRGPALIPVTLVAEQAVKTTAPVALNVRTSQMHVTMCVPPRRLLQLWPGRAERREES